MARNFREVIDRVLALVPVTAGNDELRADLEHIRHDAWFQPPESNVPWGWLRDVLEKHIDDPNEGWHVEISRVVRGTAT